jgi:hypothetical protein
LCQHKHSFLSSPIHEPRVFDPPSLIANPWEDLGSFILVDEDEGDEEDYGGGDHDGDEEDDNNAK